ncbi:MAG: glutamate 5-kinase [Spirochaeta sp.]|jgi:glutamate 5-kinase|nr:glutamate 5-kinase [Spirochaeta sp.]
MRRFDDVRRVVVKIGTNVLTRNDTLDNEYIADIARQIAAVRTAGREVCLVSSGAIGLGARELGIPGRVQDVVLRQTCAAVGQPLLMQAYREVFRAAGITVGQVLVTREAFNDRNSYVRLRNAVERLLEIGVVPVFNENDCVATAEIGTAFGDNDQLSALVASKVDAGLLVLLSDVDAYYDVDPRHNSAARPVPEVTEVTGAMLESAGKAGSQRGTGGMRTKLKAVRIAADGGCRVVLAHGREPEVLPRILAGEVVGTVFTARRTLRNRSRWLLHSEPRGRILVDEGALRAIRRHNSLLLSGVVGVEGTFEQGDVITVNADAKLVTAFGSRELELLVGHHSSEIAAVLGHDDERRLVARPEEIVFFEDEP